MGCISYTLEWDLTLFLTLDVDITQKMLFAVVELDTL